jgi:hypothetical protein
MGTNFAPLRAPVGTYLLSGSGGVDFGSFSASMRVSNALQWSNKGAITSVDRLQSLTVTWSGGPAPGHVVFGGYVAKPSGSAFLCTEDAAKARSRCRNTCCQPCRPRLLTLDTFFWLHIRWSHVLRSQGWILGSSLI